MTMTPTEFLLKEQTDNATFWREEYQELHKNEYRVVSKWGLEDETTPEQIIERMNAANMRMGARNDDLQSVLHLEQNLVQRLFTSVATLQEQVTTEQRRVTGLFDSLTKAITMRDKLATENIRLRDQCSADLDTDCRCFVNGGLACRCGDVDDDGFDHGEVENNWCSDAGCGARDACKG